MMSAGLWSASASPSPGAEEEEEEEEDPIHSDGLLLDDARGADWVVLRVVVWGLDGPCTMVLLRKE